MSLDSKSKNSISRNCLSNINGDLISVDNLTKSLSIIDVEHHEIHEGEHYHYVDYQLNNGLGDEIEFIFTPPSIKLAHITFGIFSSTGATIEIYRSPSGISGGTTIDIYNNNDDSSNISDSTIIKDPTSITFDGLRSGGFLAGSNRTAGIVEREDEYVINNIRLIRITSLAASNNISWFFDWYEH